MTKENDANARGYRDGKNGGFIDDLVQGNTKGSNSEDRAYNGGYTQGQKDRWGGSSRNPSSPSSGSSGGSSGSSGGGSSGGCYLTTACVNVMGLPDNCLELNVLRDFRDKILSKTTQGRSAIKEYYRIAPQIVSAVDSLGTKTKSVWIDTYGNIRKAVSLVLSKDFNGAYNHYKSITQDLMRKYL